MTHSVINKHSDQKKTPAHRLRTGVSYFV